MNDIYKKVLAQHTAPGQLFETKDVINEKGITYKEYVHFPDSLRGFLDFGLLHGDKDWLVYDDERYSYKDVFEKSAQFGNALIESGIEKGDRVAICMQNNPEYVFAYLGILGIGAVCVPLNSWWVPSEVIYGLEHSDAKLLIADERRLKGLESMTDVKKISTTYSP
jgi:acyl-coenzyme A synthetase/AMP-(fatty) acid ligase